MVLVPEMVLGSGCDFSNQELARVHLLSSHDWKTRVTREFAFITHYHCLLFISIIDVNK
jgi:hypothetical protein